MAEEVRIAGTGQAAKLRSPIGVAALSLVTVGIYGLIWYFKVNSELVDFGQSRSTQELGDSPTVSLLALFPGGLLIVPPIVSFFKFGKRLNRAQEMTGERIGFNPVIGVILWLIFFPIAIFLAQGSLNHVWQNQAQ